MPANVRVATIILLIIIIHNVTLYSHAQYWIPVSNDAKVSNNKFHTSVLSLEVVFLKKNKQRTRIDVMSDQLQDKAILT